MNRLLQNMIRRIIGLAQRGLALLTAGDFPPFASASVVIENQGRILMIERADGRGLSLPGGFIRLHETAEQAAVRETREETGVDIEILSLMGVLSGERAGTFVRTVEVIYEARITGGQLRNTAEGQWQWVDLSQGPVRIAFDYGDLLPDHRTAAKNTAS